MTVAVKVQLRLTVAGVALVKLTKPGATLHAMPRGVVATITLTVPVSPPSGVIVSVALAVGVAFDKVMLGGLAERLKSVTLRLIGADVDAA